MQPTLFPFGRYIFLPFKPQGYKDEFDKLSPEKIHMMDQVDHITAWTIVICILFFSIYSYSYSMK